MAKAALEALAKTLAKEERDHNIRVNVVAPGLVETEMGRRLARATRGVTDLREMDPLSPFGFVCQPEDIGNAVAFLCSEAGGTLPTTCCTWTAASSRPAAAASVRRSDCERETATQMNTA